MKIAQRTSNVQRRITAVYGNLRRSAFAVRCSMLVLLMVLLVVPHIMAQASRKALPALAPAYGEIPPTFWEQHETAIFIGSFALLALVFLLVRLRLRPESKVILPPAVVARQALEKLQSRPEDGEILSETSRILRQYFSAAFGLPATEMTTAEFCDALAAHDQIGGKLAQSVANLLSVCNKDQFAPKIIAPPINAVNRVRELISRSETRLAQITSDNPPKS